VKRRLTLIALLFTAFAGRSQSVVIDSLLRIVAKHPRDTNEIRALDYLSTEYMRKDIKKAKAYSYEHITLAKSLNTDFGMHAAYAGLVAMHQDTGNLDSARYYLDLLEKLSKQNPTNIKAASNFNNSAGLFYKNQGKYREALPFMLEGLRIMKGSKDKTAYAGHTLNAGNLYYSMADIKNAVAYHLKALTLFEEIKNKRGQSFCLASLGTDFLTLRQYTVAEKYFLQSEKLKEELGDKRGVLTCWTNLGELYRRVNKPELAIFYSNKALMRARELKLTVEELRVLFNIGSIQKEAKKTDEARKTFGEALILARQAGDSLLVSKVNTELVGMQNALQKEAKEEHILLQNIEVSLEKGDRLNSAEGHHKMAGWYAADKQFEKAYDHLVRSQQLYDSVRGNELVVQLKTLEEAYKNEKKEKEIELLKKDQELHTLAFSRQKVIIVSIAVALVSVIAIGFLSINRYRVMNRAKRAIEIEKVRNNIARDLHDDIGSTLSSINILSQVALVEEDGNTQTHLQQIGEQSARIMEDISDMVWSINPRNDSMSQVIVRMREFATDILDLKNAEYHFSEKIEQGLTLSADQRKNIFLIFKETINNAAKYSRASLIEISLHQQDQTLVMCVKDNGHGFDENLIREGNGLRNLRERAKEINGTLSLKSVVGVGTEMELQVPLA
jgi:two-component system, NarL family, sensor histidine kinase UhpB